MTEITDLRIEIKKAEIIEQEAYYPDEKIIAKYLVKRLKAKLLNLIAPQPKEL